MADETKEYALPAGSKKGIITALMVSSLTLVLMMGFGVLMLLNQGKLIHLSSTMFYQIMTAHGTGMIGVAALGGSAILWYFLSKYVPLHPKIYLTSLVLSLVGVVLILIGIFGFHFSDAWTFLYPLPAVSTKFVGKTGAYFFLTGLLILGIGFLLLYMGVARGIIKTYGSLRNGLGWDVLFGNDKEYGPPASVVASTMVVITNSTAILAGAAVIILSLMNIYNPSFTFDPLFAKHLTYAFGHVFANCTIYMAVIAVYEILSKYANRPWKSNKIFLLAWNGSTIFTLLIYTHHLLMDFAVPHWMLLVGQILSYANGLPVLVVTAYGALMIVYKAGIKWDMPSGLMLLSMFGWVAGAIPAIVDATIVVNHVMHNTKWVPGHFHTYMGLGVITMIIGFMYYFNKVEGKKKDIEWDRVSAAFYVVFFLGLSGSFLYAGKESVPRRWAEHFPSWTESDIVGAICGILIILSTLVFVIRFFSSVCAGCNDKKRIE